MNSGGGLAWAGQRSHDVARVSSVEVGSTGEGMRPQVLIVVASRHGGTLEIAGAIAQELVGHGIAATVAGPDNGTDPSRFDAILVGSAIYAGRWMKPARRFVEQHSADLVRSTVWLFSSGPLGEHHESGLDADHLEWLIEQTDAVEHREFGRRLDPAVLGPIESIVVHAVHAPTGDFRDWDDIRTWTREIVESLADHMESRSP